MTLGQQAEQRAEQRGAQQNSRETALRKLDERFDITGLWTNSDLNGPEPMGEPGPARAPNSHKLQSNPDYFSNIPPSQRAIWSIY